MADRAKNPQHEKIYNVLAPKTGTIEAPAKHNLYREFDYDAAGRVLEDRFYGNEYVSANTITNEYDPDGLLLTETKKYHSEAEQKLNYTKKNRYDKGLLVESIENNHRGTMKQRVAFMYTDRQLTREVYHNYRNHPINIHQFVYFKDGLLAEDYWMKSIHHTGHKIYSYDKQGNKLTEVRYLEYLASTGPAGVELTKTWIWEGDRCLQEETYYPKDDETYTTVKKYDDQNRLILDDRLVNMQLENSVYYRYDEQGRVSERRTVDHSGKILNCFVHLYS